MREVKQIRHNWFIIVLIAVFLAYLAIYIQQSNNASFNWLSTPSSESIYLTSYPKQVAGNSSFTVFSDSDALCILCGNSLVDISDGSNSIPFNTIACPGSVSMDCEGKLVSFSFSEVSLLPTEWARASLQTGVENKTLFIRLSGNGNTNGYRPLEIYVDGKQASAPLYSFNGTFRIQEQVPITPGTHSLQVKLLGQVLASKDVDAGPMNYPLPALLAVFLAIAIAYAHERNTLSKALVASVLIAASLVITFRFAEAGIDWLVPLVMAACLIHLLTRPAAAKKKKAAGADMERPLIINAALFGLAFALIILLINSMLSSYDVWGAYYFRHAQATFEHGTTNYFDSLSYLGRPFTYPPIFFEFAAQATGLLSQTSFEPVRVPLDIFLAFTFAATSYLLFRRLEPKSRLLAAFMFVSQWAFLLTAGGIGLHILAFTLLNISLLLVLSNPLASIAALALAFATHPITVVFFPFYLYATNGFKLDVRRMASWPIFAALISLPFYIPIFFRAGLPYEIVPQKWGYMLSYGLGGLLFDFQFLLPLLVGCIIYGIITNRYRIPSMLLAALLLINAYVSLRADLLVALVGAALFPLVFAKELKDNRTFTLLLLLFIAPNFLLGLGPLSGTGYYCAWGLGNDMCEKPMEYLATRSPANSSIALNPLYGHLEAWQGKRKVLADLYVEYANEGKFIAENSFYETGNESKLASYGVNYAVVDATMHHSASGDRVYDNGYIQIFRLRN